MGGPQALAPHLLLERVDDLRRRSSSGTNCRCGNTRSSGSTSSRTNSSAQSSFSWYSGSVSKSRADTGGGRSGAGSRVYWPRPPTRTSPPHARRALERQRGRGAAVGPPTSASHPLATLLREAVRRAGQRHPDLDAALAAHAVVGRLSDDLWSQARPSQETIDHVADVCLPAIATARTGQAGDDLPPVPAPDALPLDAIVERGQAAEAAGFEGMALMDHLAPPMAAQPRHVGGDDGGGLAAAPPSTPRSSSSGTSSCAARCGTPAVLARQAATPTASGGRFELGIEVGLGASELDTFGVKLRPASG